MKMSDSDAGGRAGLIHSTYQGGQLLWVRRANWPAAQQRWQRMRLPSMDD
jgi:hypothetical protein